MWCRTCDIQDIDVQHRTCDIVLVCTYDVVRGRTSTTLFLTLARTTSSVVISTYLSYTMSYVLKGPMISYVHASDIRYRRFILYTITTSYHDVSCMTYDVVCQHTISYARHTMSYVFWRGQSQLFEMNQNPFPQQRQIGCAFPTARSSFVALQQARQCRKHSLCGVVAP